MKKILTIIIAAIVLASCFTACASGQTSGSSSGGNTTSQEGVQSKTEQTGSSSKVEFTAEEMDDSYDEATATKIAFSSGGATVQGSGASVVGSVVLISTGGTFIVTGSTKDGQIVVNSLTKDRVQIVLNGTEINCNNNAPIFIQAAEKTVITLAKDSVNSLMDSGEYSLDTAGEPTATLFSKDDLIINGTGSLNVTSSYLDGIVSKDDLKIISGTLHITSADDGILGKDLLAVKDGDITINAVGKGLKSTNSTDLLKGLIYIEGGNFKITSTDDGLNSSNLVQIEGGNFEIDTENDGIHSDTNLTINGGDIKINNSYEGLESADIVINEGNINITSTDDGINAAESNTTTGTASTTPVRGGMGMQVGNNVMTINGGYIVVNAGGDGIDLNGNGYVTAGTLIVIGPDNSGNGALDYDGELVISGGTVLALGASGMAQVPSESSTIPVVSINLDTPQSAKTILHIEDANQNSVITFSPQKGYQSIVFASDSLEKDKSFSLYIGGSAATMDADGLCDDKGYVKGEIVETFTIVEGITKVGSQAMGGFGGGGKGERLNNGATPPERPNGQTGMQDMPEGSLPPEDKNTV